MYTMNIPTDNLSAEDMEALGLGPVVEKPEAEIQRLIAHVENQINHLVRSNRELEEFMAENGNDKELRTAIGENIAVIARRRAILDDLKKQLPTCNGSDVTVDEDGFVVGPYAAAAAAKAAAAAQDAAPPPAAAAGDGGADEGVYL